MRVFVTGASGFIGSAVVRNLLEAGHSVIGLARSDAAERAIVAAGARAHRGSLEDLESLRRGAALADGAIHTAYFHEFTHASVATRLRVMFGGLPGGIISRFLAATAETERRAIDTIGRALGGSRPALVVAAGTMAMRPGVVATEDDDVDPASPGGGRPSEGAALDLASAGIRAMVLRLPPMVHGEDDRSGFAPRLIAIARKTGASAYVGEGENRWGGVYRADAARLFRLALEDGRAGARYHAVADEGVAFRRIAEVIGRRLDVPAVSITAAEAPKRFGWLGMFVGADNPSSSVLTQTRLDWSPAGPALLDDLAGAAYATPPASRRHDHTGAASNPSRA